MTHIPRLHLIEIISCAFIIASLVYIVYYSTFKKYDSGKTWILLVAGTKSYLNYRHQADVCHAYHLFRENGIPEERIILMMYDDIAYSSQNPTPGIIVNTPNGPDVYAGINIDYSGENVTVENFANVLYGYRNRVKTVGSGRVIDSGPNDNILVNFVDYGGPGFLSFPNELLHAVDFDSILSYMVQNKRFSKMVLLIEGSFAGSMADNILSEYTNVYAITASNAMEVSHACYYDKVREAYLSNVFSANWMKIIERDLTGRLSLHNLYKKIRSITVHNHAEDYGDLNMGEMKTEIFFGSPRFSTKYYAYGDPNENAVANPYVATALFEHKLLSTDGEEKETYRNNITHLVEKRGQLDDILQKIVYDVVTDGNYKQIDRIQKYELPVTKSNMHCTKKVIEEFSKFCFNVNRNLYARNVLYMLINMCSVDFTTTEDIMRSIRSVCSTTVIDVHNVL